MVDVTEPRYIVRESRGVPVNFTYGRGAQSLTEIMVMDSWDCYRVVWSSLWLGHDARQPAHSRPRAHRTCAKWNAEHDEWMADGCLA
jgi:hypothetical protein